tara:strand:+ start:168 stop:674 length:507 start_codon:yes stop_codon:yes gene_type:complete
VLGVRTLGLLILGVLTLGRLAVDLRTVGVRTVGVRTVGVRTVDRLELDRLGVLTLGVRTVGRLGVLTLGVRTLLELRTELLEDLGALVALELLVGLERAGADLVLEEREELERELLDPERTLSWAKESAQTSISRASAAAKTTIRKETRFPSLMTGERSILTCPLLRR